MLEFLFYLKLYKAYPRVDLNSIDPSNRPAGKKASPFVFGQSVIQ